MTVREIINDFGLPQEYHPTIEKVDFEKIEKFVSRIVISIIEKFGLPKVKMDIQNDDAASEVIQLISYIIEVGGVKAICDNHLESSDSYQLNYPVIVVSLALDFALMKELRKQGVHNADALNYYNFDTLEVLWERIKVHVKAGSPNSRKQFEIFCNDMVKTNLFNKL